MTTLASTIQAFFTDYLTRQRMSLMWNST